MKTISFRAVLLLLCAMAAGCANYAIPPVQTGQGGMELAFTAAYGDLSTKTAFQSDGKSIWWSPKDEICIFYGASSGNRFTATNETDVEKAEFRGTLDTFTGTNEGGGFNYFWAVYPYGAAGSCDGESVVATLSGSQTAKAGSFAPNMNIAVAKSPGLALSFYNTCAWFKFSVVKEGIKTVTFQGNDNEDIAGTFKVTMDANDRPTDWEIVDGVKKITLRAPEGTAFEVGAWYYITLLPQTFAKGFTVTFSTGLETGSRVIENPSTYVRSMYNTGTDFDKSVVYAEGIPEDMEIAFPDPVFRTYVLENFDTNHDRILSLQEAMLITVISVNTENIKSLEGIEYMPNLQYLTCRPDYTVASLSRDSPEWTLWRGYQQEEVIGLLTTLDISKNSKLVSLRCDGNQLTSLDISQNTQLSLLDCMYNKLKSLDTHNNTVLSSLRCTSNPLTSLDISGNTSLATLDCSHNLLTDIDTRNHRALNYLNCGYNQISHIDVSNNTALQVLDCSGTLCTDLDVNSNTALSNLICDFTQITSIDVINNTALTYLECAFNKLSSIDISNNSLLQHLQCQGNLLTDLNVSNNLLLETLFCNNNQLRTLDVSNNTALWRLNCRDNQLERLDITHNTALKDLYCDSNLLTTIDVSNNAVLREITCANNQLLTLDLSKTYIGNNWGTPIKCSPMESLQTLILKKGWSVEGITVNRNEDYIPAQTQILYADEEGNLFNEDGTTWEPMPEIPEDMIMVFPDPVFRTYVLENFDTDKDGILSAQEAMRITIIDVDTENIGSLKGIEYMPNLEILYCRLKNYDHILSGAKHYRDGKEVMGELSSLDVSNNRKLRTLDCAGNKLEELDVSHNRSLVTLSCFHNNLNSLNVGNNSSLLSLKCGGNCLTSLDVSNNSILALSCSYNPLNNLNVTYNTDLTYLECSNTQLTTLDVTNLYNLQTLYCSGNFLERLDVSHNTELYSLICGDNQLTSLDVSNNVALELLFCDYNQLTTIDINNLIALRQLDVSGNQLTNLDVLSNAALTDLWCSNNQLSTLYVSNNTALISLLCINNQLSTLDVSNNTELSKLQCAGNSNLAEIWLKTGQTIADFQYDAGISTIKYKE